MPPSRVSIPAPVPVVSSRWPSLIVVLLLSLGAGYGLRSLVASEPTHVDRSQGGGSGGLRQNVPSDNNRVLSSPGPAPATQCDTAALQSAVEDAVQIAVDKAFSSTVVAEALRNAVPASPTHQIDPIPVPSLAASPCPSSVAIHASPLGGFLWQSERNGISESAPPLPIALPAWVWVRNAGRGEMRTLTADEMQAVGDYALQANAQFGEDLYLLENFFWGRADGIILESGALDGIRISTSFFFHSLFGWKSIHVDANPNNYRRLVANRHDALNIHLAICKAPRVVHWLAETEPIVDMAHLKQAEVGALPPSERGAQKVQIGSGVGGIFEFMPQSLIRDFYPLIAAKGAAAVNDLPAVMCRPLAPVLGMFGISHVNIWVLDVEGAELEVLEAIDFTAVSFDVIFVEADGGNPEKDAGVIALLKRQGFVHHGNLLRSDWFVRKGFTPSKKP